MKIKKLMKLMIKIVVLMAVVAIGINIYVIKSAEEQIAATFDSYSDTLQQAELDRLKALDADCIMVLGASVYPDGTPSPMLKDRLDAGIQLYHAKVADKLLLTGDDGQKEYNEVSVMHDYAIDNGVREEDIFLDHAGFSTYESIYRAQDIFECQSMVIVTQEYHLYRSIYGGKRKGIKSLGVAANQDQYKAQGFREIREIVARNKDFVMWVFKPNPTFLGDIIPIDGDGISTH